MRGTLVLLVTALMLLTSALTSAQDGPSGLGTPTTAIPATAVGHQLTWVLAQLNGDAESLSDGEVSTHVAPAFLAAFPVPLRDLLQQTAAHYAPATVTGRRVGVSERSLHLGGHGNPSWRFGFRRNLHPHQVTGGRTDGTTEDSVALEDAGIPTRRRSLISKRPDASSRSHAARSIVLTRFIRRSYTASL